MVVDFIKIIQLQSLNSRVRELRGGKATDCSKLPLRNPLNPTISLGEIEYIDWAVLQDIRF
ncbi:MAG: hypothetical protein C0599_01815 [Salinivirgaceae bacterium]|nr:MAG: hypothetical protein C0599_01815 [Salinivirgaceae bacterium]